MQAVLQFKNSKKEDFKRYKHIYKSKKPNETSVQFFAHIENEYKNCSQEELVNLESYLDDYLGYLEACHNRSRILSGMDYKIAGLLPVFMASLVSVIAIIASVTGELFQFVDDIGVKNIYRSIADLCYVVMESVGVGFLVCVLFFIFLGLLDGRIYMNKCYEERFVNGYIKAVRKCVARKYLD